MTTMDFALMLFSACNFLRVLAYIPQLVCIAKDDDGAAAISNLSWMLFAVSHLSTATYSILVLADSVMMLIFLTNAAFCFAVVGLTAYKRQRKLRFRPGVAPAIIS